MMTLCDTLSFPIAQKVRTEYDSAKTGNKLSQKINKTHALYVIKDNLINFFVKNMYYKALDISDYFIENNREILRPGRSFERNKKPKKRFYTNYKPL